MPEIQNALLTYSGEGAAFTPEGERDAAAMLRALRRIGQEPALFVVIAQGPAREEFLRRFRVWRRLDGVPRFNELGTGAEGVRRLDLKLRGHGGQHFGLLMPDADALETFEDGRVLQGLNIARDSLERVAHGPLVLMFSEEGARRFAEHAPDLYDARTMTAVFDAVEPAFGVSTQRNGRQKRADSLSELLAQEARVREQMSAEDAMPTGAAIDRLLSIAGRLRTIEQYSAQMRIAQECADLSRQHGYVEGLGRSIAMRVQAQMHYLPAAGLLGELDEALQIGREHQLDRLLLLSGYLTAVLEARCARYSEASQLLESTVIPSAESIGELSFRLYLQSFLTATRADSGADLQQCIARLREINREMESTASPAPHLRSARFFLAALLIRLGTTGSYREAHTLLSKMIPSAPPSERAQLQPLLQQAQRALGLNPTVGPNRAARRAKKR